MKPFGRVTRAVPSLSPFPIGVAIAAWLFLGGYFAIPVGRQSEASGPITSWLLTGAGCGAFAHAALLLSRHFRRLEMGRIAVVWLAAMILLLGVRLAMRWLEPNAPAHESLAAGGAWALVPMFAASATVSWLVERAEA